MKNLSAKLFVFLGTAILLTSPTWAQQSSQASDNTISPASKIISFTPEQIDKLFHHENYAHPNSEVALLINSPQDKQKTFVMRMKFPANAQIACHSHPIDAYKTIISGELYLGPCDATPRTRYPRGSFIYLPKNTYYQGYAGEEGVTTQEISVGPWLVNYK